MKNTLVKSIDLHNLLDEFEEEWSFNETRSTQFNIIENVIIIGGTGSGNIYFIDFQKSRLVGTVVYSKKYSSSNWAWSDDRDQSFDSSLKKL